MDKKREQHEIKIIIILVILSIVFYGLTFGIKAIKSHQSDDIQEYIDRATMTESSTKVEVTDDIEPFTLEKIDNKWQCLEDDEFYVSTLSITMMRTVLKYFTPERVILDAGDRWSEFGLDHPHRVMTLTSGEKCNTYLIGDYNPVLGEYYMAMEGDDAVYLMSKEDMESFDLPLLGYANDPAASQLQGDDIAHIRVRSASDKYDISVDGKTYTVNTGLETFTASQYDAMNILTTFSSNTYTCAAHNVSGDGFKKYGLDDPEAVVTFTDLDGKDYELRVSVGEDGGYYMNENGSGMIYTLMEDKYEKLFERIKVDSLRG